MNILCLIPARGGSKGFPGKNLALLSGSSLLSHSIRYAKSLPGISDIAVSTEDPLISLEAVSWGAEVINRPTILAQDNTPIWPVIKHALNWADGGPYDYLLMLEVPSPVRDVSDFTGMVEALDQTPEADGVVTGARPYFESWATIVRNKDGWVRNLDAKAGVYYQRQQVPPSFRYSGMYLWRAEYVRNHPGPVWLTNQHLLHETESRRAYSIDTAEELEMLQVLLNGGFLKLPWI